MIDLNEFITKLFWKMIKSPDKILTVENGEIKFDNELSIRAFKKRSDEEAKSNKPLTLDENTFTSYGCFWSYFDVVIPDTDKLIFYINTPYKQYVVPEFTNRHEYAEVLNTIDDSLKQFEIIKLNEYDDYFTPLKESSPYEVLAL